MGEPVFPSFLNAVDMGSNDLSDVYDNPGVFYGEVKEVVYPSSQRSFSKRVTEYTVEVQYATIGGGSGTTRIMRGVVAASLFGGAADVVKFTYRQDGGELFRDDGFGTGSKVLVLCINGRANEGVIISGAPDFYSNSKLKDSSEDGHHFKFQFNGFSFNINKNGTAAMTYRGATNYKDEVKGEANLSQQEKEKSGSGSNINFAQDGSIFLQAGDRGDGRLMIALHHNANLLVLRNAYEFSEFSESNEIEEIANLSEGAKASDDPTKETGTIVLSAMGRVYLNGEEGVHIGAGGSSKEKMPLFESYRSEEKNMHDTLKEKLDTLNQKAIKISTTFQTATFYTAFTCLTTAASDFQEMATAFSAMKSAIEDFESKAENYLSPKNIND